MKVLKEKNINPLTPMSHNCLGSAQPSVTVCVVTSLDRRKEVSVIFVVAVGCGICEQLDVPDSISRNLIRVTCVFYSKEPSSVQTRAIRAAKCRQDFSQPLAGDTSSPREEGRGGEPEAGPRAGEEAVR